MRHGSTLLAALLVTPILALFGCGGLTEPESGVVLTEPEVLGEPGVGPSLSDSRVAWRDVATGQVVVLDLETGDRLRRPAPRSKSLFQFRPSLSGDCVVWSDLRPGGIGPEGDLRIDVRVLDLASGEIEWITDDPALDLGPEVHRDQVVWETRLPNSDGSTDREIVLFDLEERARTQLTDDTLLQVNPAVSERGVAWNEVSVVNGFLGESRLVLHDFTTGERKQLAREAGDIRLVGSRAVWANFAGTGGRIEVVDLDTGARTRVNHDAGTHRRPDLSGTFVVWERKAPDGTGDVMLADLATGAIVPVATGPADQRYPVIDGRRIVWEEFGGAMRGFRIVSRQIKEQ